MGSSSNDTYPDPGPVPTPPNTVPYGQSAPYAPRFLSFLPSDNSMATGLTPSMIAQTNAPPPAMPAPQQNPMAAQQAAQAAQVQKQRQDLAMQMAMLQSANRQGYAGSATNGPLGMYYGGSWNGGRAGGGGVGGYGPGHS